MTNKEEFRVVPSSFSIRKRITDIIGLGIIALVSQDGYMLWPTRKNLMFVPHSVRIGRQCIDNIALGIIALVSQTWSMLWLTRRRLRFVLLVSQHMQTILIYINDLGIIALVSQNWYMRWPTRKVQGLFPCLSAYVNDWQIFLDSGLSLWSLRIDTCCD